MCTELFEFSLVILSLGLVGSVSAVSQYIAQRSLLCGFLGSRFSIFFQALPLYCMHACIVCQYCHTREILIYFGAHKNVYCIRKRGFNDSPTPNCKQSLELGVGDLVVFESPTPNGKQRLGVGCQSSDRQL